LKPGRAAEWRALQQNDVIPALKKVGVTTRTTLETLFGNTNEYVTLRPLDKFAEYDEQQGLLQRTLGTQAGNAVPMMQKAQAAGTVAGFGISITHQGAEEQGLRILTTYYPTLAALDAAVAAGGVVQATVGETQAATLATQQACLATAVYTTIRRRVAELSY
jgi:hypothetical protein